MAKNKIGNNTSKTNKTAFKKQHKVTIMKKHSLALNLLAALSSSFGGAQEIQGSGFSSPTLKAPKGQLRTAKPKPSNAAQLKREAKKRNNIRKRK